METAEEITVTIDAGELIASISLKEGNVIVRDGYLVNFGEVEFVEPERK